MSLITIFTSPKSFKDPHINIIQRNAIKSWKALGESVEILLFGDDFGTADIAEELGITHIPEIQCNKEGTPLLSAMFAQAQEISSTPIMAYVNADIILLSDLVRTTQQIMERFNNFLLVGSRWNMDITEPLPIEQPDWASYIRERLNNEASQHVPTGSDYFIYSKPLLKNIPEFAIGRAGWDNWVIYHGVTQPWPIIDTGAAIKAIHQNHDYKHLPQGQAHYNLPESQENIRLAGGHGHMFTMQEVNLRYANKSLERKKLSINRMLHRIELFLTHPEIEPGKRWGLILLLRKIQGRLS